MTRWPTNNALAGDPARYKSRYMTGSAPLASNYLDRVKAYNADLYQPADTKRAAVMPTIAPLSTQGATDPSLIAARYGTPGTYAMGNTLQNKLNFRPDGVAGPLGTDGDSAQPQAMPPSAINDPSTMAQMPPEAPRQNAQQRWMPQSKVADEKEAWAAEGGSQRTWNRAGVAAGIRPRIDGRARQSSRNSDASAAIREKWGFAPDSMKLPY